MRVSGGGFRAIACCSMLLSSALRCSCVIPHTLVSSSSAWHPAKLAELWINACHSSCLIKKRVSTLEAVF